MASHRFLAAALAAGTALAAIPAHAATFGATELSQDNALLSQFNLISLGNLTQSGTSATANTIQGRAIVGGNATFGTGANVCGTNCTNNATLDASLSTGTANQKYGALTVFGNLTNASTTAAGAIDGTTVAAGDVDVKGTMTGNVLLNGSNPSPAGGLNITGSASGGNVANAGFVRTSQSSFAGGNYTYSTSTGQVTGGGPAASTGLSAASVFPFSSNYQGDLTNLARGLAYLPGTPGVSAQALPTNTTGFFTVNNDYTANGFKYGVVTTTLTNLGQAISNGLTGFNTGTNNATVVLVSGDGANYVLPNLGSYTGANSVIFDFVNATTLKFAGNWNGSILAPLATVQQQGGTLNGSVIVASINQANALNDGATFAGNLSGLVGIAVPEPASLALLGLGAAAAAGLARRRRG